MAFPERFICVINSDPVMARIFHLFVQIACPCPNGVQVMSWHQWEYYEKEKESRHVVFIDLADNHSLLLPPASTATLVCTTMQRLRFAKHLTMAMIERVQVHSFNENEHSFPLSTLALAWFYFFPSYVVPASIVLLAEHELYASSMDHAITKVDDAMAFYEFVAHKVRRERLLCRDDDDFRYWHEYWRSLIFGNDVKVLERATLRGKMLIEEKVTRAAQVAMDVTYTIKQSSRDTEICYALLNCTPNDADAIAADILEHTRELMFVVVYWMYDVSTVNGRLCSRNHYWSIAPLVQTMQSSCNSFELLNVTNDNGAEFRMFNSAPNDLDALIENSIPYR